MTHWLSQQPEVNEILRKMEDELVNIHDDAATYLNKDNCKRNRLAAQAAGNNVQDAKTLRKKKYSSKQQLVLELEERVKFTNQWKAQFFHWGGYDNEYAAYCHGRASDFFQCAIDDLGFLSDVPRKEQAPPQMPSGLTDSAGYYLLPSESPYDMPVTAGEEKPGAYPLPDEPAGKPSADSYSYALPDDMPGKPDAGQNAADGAYNLPPDAYDLSTEDFVRKDLNFNGLDARYYIEGDRSLRVKGPRDDPLILADLGNIDEILKDAAAQTYKYWQTLEVLMLGGTQVTDKGLKDVAPYLPNLQALHVDDTQVTGTGVKDAAPYLQKLTLLNINGTDVTDKGLKDVASNLPNLKHLCLMNTAVTDAGLMEAAPYLTKLESFDLTETSVTDAGLNDILEHCPNVKRLDLSSTKVTEQGIKEISKQSSSCKFNMGVVRDDGKSYSCSYQNGNQVLIPVMVGRMRE